MVEAEERERWVQSVVVTLWDELVTGKRDPSELRDQWSSRSASRRDEDVVVSWTARGNAAGCSGVANGVRRYARMCVYLTRKVSSKATNKLRRTHGALGLSRKICIPGLLRGSRPDVVRWLRKIEWNESSAPLCLE